MTEALIPLKAVKFYHIYNNVVCRELFFESDMDYTYFLKKPDKYVTPLAEVYAYCLLPRKYVYL